MRAAKQGHRFEVEQAKPMLRASSSSVLRSEVRETASLDDLQVGTGMALPCLQVTSAPDKINVLTASHKRTAFMVAFEIECLVQEFGIDRIGFFTLTFKDHVTDLREAQKRFRSLRAHVIVKRYRRAIGVWERHKSGRIHFHLVVVLDLDIRSGADFQAFKRKDYRSANSALRAEWAFWRQTCPKYRFGRHELMPVKSTAQGIARYVGKYISKHVGQRLEADKGARVVRFIGFKPGMRRTCCRFSWNNDNGWLWRQKLASFAARNEIKDLDHMKRRFGRRWAYRLQERILAEPLGADIVYRSRSAADREWLRCLEQDAIRDRAERIFEGATLTVLLHSRNFDNSSPVWAVPEWFGEQVETEPPTAEAVRDFQEQAKAMRHYAATLPPMAVSKWKTWMDYTLSESGGD
jgi:hypothetical protein